MKAYVAARFSQYERARALMDAMTAAGYEITFDWTRTEEFGADGHPRFAAKQESGIPPTRLAEHARNDIDGAADADVIVVIADDTLCGALIELGATLAAGGSAVIIGPPWRWTVFWHHPAVTLLPDEETARRRLGVRGIERTQAA